MSRIHKLDLFEVHLPDKDVVITRVPGGWVFSNIRGSCFIPYSEEFGREPIKGDDETRDAIHERRA